MMILLATLMISLGNPEEVSLLSEQQGKEIAVKGYLHRSPQGAQILTPNPNTPSCCLASPHKREEQVVLQGEVEVASSDHPITVKGILHVSSSDPRFELMGSEVLVDENRRKIPWATFSFGIFLLGGFFVILFLIKKKEIDR